jgi:hypothetical protein
MNFDVINSVAASSRCTVKELSKGEAAGGLGRELGDSVPSNEANFPPAALDGAGGDTGRLGREGKRGVGMAPEVVGGSSGSREMRSK